MEKIAFTKNWIDGFCKEAKSIGLSDEQISALLKIAAVAELRKSDKSFDAGYCEEMAKSAGMGSLISGGLLGGAGVLGVTALMGDNLTPEQEHTRKLREAALYAPEGSDLQYTLQGQLTDAAKNDVIRRAAMLGLSAPQAKEFTREDMERMTRGAYGGGSYFQPYQSPYGAV
jgi:hypothetical protein